MTWLLAICIAVIPLGTRLMLGSLIPGVHEYESLFLYGSDIFLLIFTITACWYKRLVLREFFHRHGGVLLSVFLVAAIASVVHAPSLGLGVYSVVRLVVLVAFAYAIGSITTSLRLFQIVLVAISIGAVTQGALGIAQFAQQGSIGLQALGEPHLVVSAGAASTIGVEGGRVLRAYGTFPHPNVLAGFLALGLVSLGYLYLWCEERLKKDIFNHPRSWWNWRHGVAALRLYLRHRYFYIRLLIAAGAFIVTVGLALSLSRSGWLAGLIGVLVFAVNALRVRDGRGGAVRLLLMIAVCVSMTYLMFALIVAPRAQVTRAEPAVNERLLYGKIGLDILSSTIGGVGAGNQVFYSVEHGLYSRYALTKVWNWEPIHNLYLLIGAELGWLGLLSFLIFLGMVACGRYGRALWREASSDWGVAMALLATILVLGFFDHYLWTLQPGRLMLWLVIGLCIGRLAASKK